jgi:hypothetical protein
VTTGLSPEEKEQRMDGYMQKPSTMDDATLQGWLKNFQDQPPTMDYMAEHSWAMAVIAEAKRREEAR